MKKNVPIWIIGFVFVFIAVSFAFIFAYKHNLFDCSQPALTEIIGQYGDFIGGLVGTIFAFISIVLLWKTFSIQNEVNESIKKTNESVVSTNNKVIVSNEKIIEQNSLMIFDNKFKSFLTMYHDAISSYTRQDCSSGRDSFEVIVNDFKKLDFDKDLSFPRLAKAAIEVFKDNLYAVNRSKMSVHMRTLYLLMQLISEDTMLTEDQRAVYAKCIRGQLTDNEMLVVRYNCFSSYGEKMKYLANEFNLLKHLPPMSLLEFYRYRTLVDSKAELINSIDALLLDIRRIVTHSFNLPLGGETKVVIPISRQLRYMIIISEDRRDYTFILFFDRQRKQVGNVQRPEIENALFAFSDEELNRLVYDFHFELFFTSNFNLYNSNFGGNYSEAEIDKPTTKRDGDNVTITCKIHRDKPLILRYYEYKMTYNTWSHTESWKKC